MDSRFNFSGHSNPHLEASGFVTMGFQVDLADGLDAIHKKVIAVLAPILPRDRQITVVLPGLAPLAAVVLTAIHGLTGSFPVVVALVKDADGQFVPTIGWDAQAARNSSRPAREGMVRL